MTWHNDSLPTSMVGYRPHQMSLLIYTSMVFNGNWWHLRDLSMVCQWFFVNHCSQWFYQRFKSKGFQCQRWCQCTVLFSTELLMWPVLKGPEGPDQPSCLLSKQSSQSWTSQLQLWLCTVDSFVYLKENMKRNHGCKLLTPLYI